MGCYEIKVFSRAVSFREYSLVERRNPYSKTILHLNMQIMKLYLKTGWT